jgi:hypothetical protein
MQCKEGLPIVQRGTLRPREGISGQEPTSQTPHVGLFLLFYGVFPYPSWLTKTQRGAGTGLRSPSKSCLPRRPLLVVFKCLQDDPAPKGVRAKGGTPLTLELLKTSGTPRVTLRYFGAQGGTFCQAGRWRCHCGSSLYYKKGQS